MKPTSQVITSATALFLNCLTLPAHTQEYAYPSYPSTGGSYGAAGVKSSSYATSNTQKGTIDAAGTVYDDTGHVMCRVIFDTADPGGALSIDTSGNVSDTSGRIIGHVAKGSASAIGGYNRESNRYPEDPYRRRDVNPEAMRLPDSTDANRPTIDARGNIVDASGKIIGRVAPERSTPNVASTPKSESPAPKPVASSSTNSLGPDVTGRRSKLEAFIKRELTSGRITTWQADNLYVQLASICEQEAKYVRRGRLSLGKKDKLDRRWDQVEAKLNSYVVKNRQMAMRNE